MINSELLKEAICDAKAVRATAVLNAKHALEEAFAPRFHAMFSDKLKEDAGEEGLDEVDQEPVAEVSAPNQVSGKGGEAKGPQTKDVSKGQPKKVSDGNTNFKTVKAGKGPDGVPAGTDSIMKETSELELEGETGITSEDLDEIIKELEAEVAGEAEGESPEDPTADPSAQLPIADPNANPAALGAPAPAPEGDPAALGAPAPVPTGVPGAEPDGDEAVPAPVNPEDDVEEEIDLNALLEALTDEETEVSEGKLPPWLKKKGEKSEDEDDDDDDDKKEKVDEIANQGLPTKVDGQDKSGGVKGYPAAPKDASKNQVKGKNKDGCIGSGTGTGLSETSVLKKENTDLKDALNEHVKAIKYLQGQINEVNLLNAKLLYTTKMFKEFSLDNKQKMRVVETFDLLKNVREVKLTYAGMCEALNFGASKKPLAPKAIIQKRITESYASRPVPSTKPATEILSESTDMANRFKKLAGIGAKKNKPVVIKHNQ